MPTVPRPLPGVVANCTTGAPYKLTARPASIVQACGDGGLGVEKVTWTSWSASAATGRGVLWAKVCVPNCAAGGIRTYPVRVSLSSVRNSPTGPWFSVMSVTWEGKRPPGVTASHWSLWGPPAS